MSFNKTAKSREQVIDRDKQQIFYNKNTSCFTAGEPGASHPKKINTK